MPGVLEKLATFLGRFLLGLLFLMSGAHKCFSFEGTTALMAAEGMIATTFFLSMAAMLEICGSLSVIVGYKARLGALALVVFLVPATLVFHDFWRLPGHEGNPQMFNFLKNITILGGLLFVIGRGAGPWSVDDFLESREWVDDDSDLPTVL